MFKIRASPLAGNRCTLRVLSYERSAPTHWQRDCAAAAFEAHGGSGEANPCGVMVLGAKGRKSDLAALAVALLTGKEISGWVERNY